jgi:hypothetical protein
MSIIRSIQLDGLKRPCKPFCGRQSAMSKKVKTIAFRLAAAERRESAPGEKTHPQKNYSSALSSKTN